MWSNSSKNIWKNGKISTIHTPKDAPFVIWVNPVLYVRAKGMRGNASMPLLVWPWTSVKLSFCRGGGGCDLIRFTLQLKEVWGSSRHGRRCRALVLPWPRGLASRLGLSHSTQTNTHVKHTLRPSRRFLSPSPSLQPVARQWKHWKVVSMAWPGLLFDRETYAFYMLQLCHYQMAVKHTNHAPSFVPPLTLCTVPHRAVAPSVCLFAYGGSTIPRTGLCPSWQKTHTHTKNIVSRSRLLDWNRLVSNARLPCLNIKAKLNTDCVALAQHLTGTSRFCSARPRRAACFKESSYQADLQHVQLNPLLWLSLCASTKEAKKDTADLT